MAGLRPLLALFFAFCICGEVKSAQYLGKFLGKLSELHHGVSGEVYAVDSRTLHIKDFSYDGQGPAAYFYASTSKAANNAGFRLRDESGSGDVIRRYRKEGVTLTLPEGKSLNNIKIFYVWCEEFAVNFGDVKIPRSFDYPRPQKIDALKGVHNVASDNIVIVDAQTLLIPNLSYDGEAPDAKFWVGRGAKPTPQGIRVPDENGKEVPLRRYDGKTVVLTLPGGLTVFDIGHFGIWCEAFTVDFGHVRIPQNLNIPPSLKMLGVSPQKRPQHFDISREVLRSRPRVGGHLEATTYRPARQFSFNNGERRVDVPQHELVNRDIYAQQQQQQKALLQQQQQNLLYQQQIFAQQRAYQIQQQQQQQQYNNLQYYQQQQPQQQQIVPVAYTPLNLHQRQQQEQIAYNQLLQNSRIQQEQKLREQLNRQHNRFILPANQNAYVPFG